MRWEDGARQAAELAQAGPRPSCGPSPLCARIAARWRRELRRCVLQARLRVLGRALHPQLQAASIRDSGLRCVACLARFVRRHSGMADLDTVISLTIKAELLNAKCHFERSLLKYRAALAAAEALGADNCVIVADIAVKVARVSCLVDAVGRRALTQELVLETFAQYAASAAILRRRRDAGTLLGGKCRPDEVRWQLESLRATFPIISGSAEVTPSASLVGYDTFLELVYSCIELAHILLSQRLCEPGGEVERTWLSFTCDLCDEAVALMIQPREVENQQSNAECSTYFRMQKLKEELSKEAAMAHRRLWHVRVAVAIARLQQSGVLEERGIGNESEMRNVALAEQRAVRSAQERASAAASGQLRSCASATCGAREAHPSHFSKCGGCKTVAYCCRDHQLADWPSHKAACKAARKAAAAANDAA